MGQSDATGLGMSGDVPTEPALDLAVGQFDATEEER